MQNQKGVRCLQNLSAKWVSIFVLIPLLIIGCAAPSKVKKEDRVAAPTAASHQDAAGQEFVRKAVKALDLPHDITVHIDNGRPHVLGLEHGITIPAFLGFIHGCAGWINSRISHNAAPAIFFGLYHRHLSTVLSLLSYPLFRQNQNS